jgi:hypothetical protein
VAHIIQTGLWRWVKSTGLERFELVRNPQEWMLRGTILVSGESGPTEARYEVVCDDAWNTKRAHISLRDGTDERVLRVTVEDGKWHVNGHENDSVTECKDIDLEWSPSTNTLPIRRLHLAVGEKAAPFSLLGFGSQASRFNHSSKNTNASPTASIATKAAEGNSSRTSPSTRRVWSLPTAGYGNGK